MKSAFLKLLAALYFTAPSPGYGQQSVVEQLQTTSLSFSGGHRFTNAVLTITGPHGYMREETALRGLPVFRLQTAGRLSDGYYRYALVAASDQVAQAKPVFANGRASATSGAAKVPFALYGAFLVQAGRFIPIPQDGSAENGSSG